MSKFSPLNPIEIRRGILFTFLRDQILYPIYPRATHIYVFLDRPWRQDTDELLFMAQVDMAHVAWSYDPHLKQFASYGQESWLGDALRNQTVKVTPRGQPTVWDQISENRKQYFGKKREIDDRD